VRKKIRIAGKNRNVAVFKKVSYQGAFFFLFFISKSILSIEHNFTEEMEDQQNTVMFNKYFWRITT